LIHSINIHIIKKIHYSPISIFWIGYNDFSYNYKARKKNEI